MRYIRKFYYVFGMYLGVYQCEFQEDQMIKIFTIWSLTREGASRPLVLFGCESVMSSTRGLIKERTNQCLRLYIISLDERFSHFRWNPFLYTFLYNQYVKKKKGALLVTLLKKAKAYLKNYPPFFFTLTDRLKCIIYIYLTYIIRVPLYSRSILLLYVYIQSVYV